MKVKTITRTAETHSRERKGDIFVVKQNEDVTLHPFERAREYVRAVNAAKLDRIFAKPFVASLSGHVDGVYCMNTHPTDLKLVASGAGDGEVRLWNLATQKCLWSRKNAHEAFIKGVTFVPYSNSVLSCGDDKRVRLWNYSMENGICDNYDKSPMIEPTSTFEGKGVFTGIDGNLDGKRFATSGSEQVSIWDLSRLEPIQSYTWGADTINSVRFNRAEPSLLASCASDRSLMIHDLRINHTIRKVILKMKSNAVAWNPQEAFYLSAANEDHNVYTFDMRYFDRAVNVMQGHVSAILDLDYSPTGQEIVTAGYDKSLRIFNIRQGRSRDIYHNRRMQRLFCVRYSMDSKYIMSGSDDGNVRIWKAAASEQLGIKNHRQQAALDYNSKVLDRFKALPEVRRIANHRQIPKQIKVFARNTHEHLLSQRRKAENVKKNSRPDDPTANSTRNVRDTAILQVK